MSDRTEVSSSNADGSAADQPPTAPPERILLGDDRMSDVEALMWNVEKDPHLDPTFGSVTILDRRPDLERLRRRLIRMVDRIPRLHQRVVPALGRLAPPAWQDDPEFDIDYHFRHLGLPAPGSRRQLLDFATQFVRDPFDRTRPLWEFVVVEGVEGDRAALVQKMHHTITDGEGGVRMSEQFIDVERDAPDIDEVEIELAPPPADSNVVETAVDTLGHTWRRTLGIAQRATSSAAESLAHPDRLASFGPDLLEMARSAIRQLTVTDPAHSPLWLERSLRRRLEVIDVPFDDARTAAKALGGSLNDFFVAGAAGGAGAYHRQLGAPVDSLRMAMPVSTRTDRSAGGNAFVPTRAVIPIPNDPVERFEVIHRQLEETKHEKVIGVVSQLAGVLNLLPTSVLARFTLEQARTVDFTTSNVRAAPFDLFIAGAHIEATYPMGPLSNTAFNLTMMSYRGELNMGLHIDTGAIAEPERLRDCIADSYAQLIAAAR
jgi:WS/DGAT/MGAT family acyltransferase